MLCPRWELPGVWGGPSRVSPYTAVSPGERGSPLRSREQHRSHAEEQSSSSSLLPMMGHDRRRDSAAKGSAWPRHPGRDEPGESRSPGPLGSGR